MRRVKLITILAGPDGCHDAGSVVELPDDRAAALIAGSFAVPVDGPADDQADDPGPAAESGPAATAAPRAEPEPTPGRARKPRR